MADNLNAAIILALFCVSDVLAKRLKGLTSMQNF